MFYRMFSELPPTDAPDREVIEDDERIDRWYDHYLQKMTRDAQLADKGRAAAPSGWEVPQFGGV